jgi:hypothetical protein
MTVCGVGLERLSQHTAAASSSFKFRDDIRGEDGAVDVNA